MHRRTAQGSMAVLALVATLGVLGAHSAAAADLSDLRAVDRLASLGAALSAGPAALWDALMGWFGESRAAKSAEAPDPPLNDNSTMGMDPNGILGGGS